MHPLTGMAWVSAFSSLNATAQEILPAWVRSRALAAYVLVFYGGQAVATAGWGVVAQRATTSSALVAAALTLFASSAARARLRLVGADGVDPRPSRHWAEPDVVLEPGDYPGPVMVVLEHRVPTENAVAFVAAMQPVGRARRRSGARQWALYRDAADPERSSRRTSSARGTSISDSTTSGRPRLTGGTRRPPRR